MPAHEPWLPPAHEPAAAPEPWLEELPPPRAAWPAAEVDGPEPFLAAANDDFWYHVGGQARGYYINDQRIEFTGAEETFAVEGVVAGGVWQRAADWELSLAAELFLNQPLDRNILVDTPERRSFASNFDIDTFQISQLYLGVRQGDFYAAIGRFVTPFGRFYFRNYRNNFDDSPFIRSEAILFRETGAVLQWDPEGWVFTAAVTNGGFQQDTNSSKALVARLGIDRPWLAAGASVKVQDGIGSETQKAYNEHVGLDAMIRRGLWTLSGEVIYDRYGLRWPGIPLNDVFWGRSLYYRDLNNGPKNPITGIGYYINLGYEGPHWSLALNYGEFYPEHVWKPEHNATTRRGILKASRFWTRHFETYGLLLLENCLPSAFDNSTRRGVYVLAGCQFTL